MMTEKEKAESKIIYTKLKAQGICPKCGKYQHAPGRVHCMNCLDEFAVCKMIQRANMTEEQKEQERKQVLKGNKERYVRLKSLGICVRCGKRPVKKKGGAKCYICQEKENEQKRIKYRERKDDEKK